MMVAQYDSDSDLFFSPGNKTGTLKQDFFHMSPLEYTQSCYEVNNKS